jgi:CTP synthase (UTP-ammonia lyase)
MIGEGGHVLRIGIIGDFNSKYRTHVAIDAAIEHVSAAIREDVRSSWIPTCSIAKDGSVNTLSGFDALWAAPASPYESAEGMLLGIEYARSRDIPFTGT